MAKRNIGLIATDLDDTLLRRDKAISAHTKSVFARCREKGILIAFATARTEKASERFIRQISPDIVISDMGALARRGEETLYETPIPTSDALALLQKCLSDPRVAQIILQADSGYYCSRPLVGEGWEDYTHAKTVDFSKPADYGKIYRVTIQAFDAQTPRDLSKGFPDTGTTSYRHDGWHAMHGLDVSKGRTLRAVADVINIPIENIAAFGDDTSDIGMLRAAGIGVAMRNAIPEVKAAADFICDDCDNDGVAKWLEENIL
ncbi:MAG: Cof-type HAD-IIB family hydrolase [Treponema sp.]|nr:Cof-type HAD-IIB family hydrolase [Treponema sp.]